MPEPDGHIIAVGRFAERARAEGLGSEHRADSARRVLDVAGNALAARAAGADGAVSGVVAEWGGAQRASAVGHSRRYPAPQAAMVNGVLAHALDFDDTHFKSVLHPSASVVPAALAAAEDAGAGAGELLDAISVGNEICVRLGLAGYNEKLGNSVFFERGQHATAICGAVASAVAAAMLYRLEAAEIASAAAVAASMGAGLLEANRTGGTVKRLHCGWAAHAGVAAAQFARAGITGPPTVLEGRFGFFQAWCGEHADPGVVVAGLGERWESLDIAYKPYPCNAFTHTGIDAALELRGRGLRPERIDSVELGVASSTLRTIAQPEAAKAAPATGYAAAFSGPFTVAAALVGGGGLGLWLDDFTDAAANDPALRALAAKVTCRGDERCDEVFPEHFPSVLRVRTVDGELLEARVETNRGGSARPLSSADLAVKFRLGAAKSLPEAAVAELEGRIFALPRNAREGHAPVEALAALLRRAGSLEPQASLSA